MRKHSWCAQPVGLYCNWIERYTYRRATSTHRVNYRNQNCLWDLYFNLHIVNEFEGPNLDPLAVFPSETLFLTALHDLFRCHTVHPCNITAVRDWGSVLYEHLPAYSIIQNVARRRGIQLTRPPRSLVESSCHQEAFLVIPPCRAVLKSGDMCVSVGYCTASY